MKPHLSAALTALIVGIALSATAEEKQFHARADVFRIPFGTPIEFWNPAKTTWQDRTPSKPVAGFAANGQIRIGSTAVQLGPVTSPVPRESLLNNESVSQLSSPRIIFRESDDVLMRIEGTDPLEYLEPSDKEGWFVLRQTAQLTGLELRLNLLDLEGNTARLKIKLSTRFVRDRRFLEGTSLRAGVPIIDSRETDSLVAAKLGERFVLLSNLGEKDGDVLAAFFEVQEHNTVEASGIQTDAPVVKLSEIDENTLPQYTLELKFVQVDAQPDWAFWTRGYKGAFEFSEGAGRVFGPVVLSGPIEVERANEQIGFPQAVQKEMFIISAPRLTHLLDHRKLIESENAYSAMKLIVNSPSYPPLPDSITPMTDAAKRSRGRTNLTDLLNPLYDSLALHPAKLGREELLGRAVITDAYATYDGKVSIAPPPGKGNGVMLIAGADSTDEASIYTLDLAVLVREELYERGWIQSKLGDRIVHAQFQCVYDVANESTTAFMVPVDGRSSVVVVAQFSVVKP